jgi:hypothetical protein
VLLPLRPSAAPPLRRSAPPPLRPSAAPLSGPARPTQSPTANLLPCNPPRPAYTPPSRSVAGPPRDRTGANIAQLVEQLIRNQQVSGSSPDVGSKITGTYGGASRGGARPVRKRSEGGWNSGTRQPRRRDVFAVCHAGKMLLVPTAWARLSTRRHRGGRGPGGAPQSAAGTRNGPEPSQPSRAAQAAAQALSVGRLRTPDDSRAGAVAECRTRGVARLASARKNLCAPAPRGAAVRGKRGSRQRGNGPASALSR